MSSLATPFMVMVGLMLFLYGMDRLEAGIRTAGYETFKNWISRSTASPVSSAGVGIATTAVLQSSSLVSLLVLAFASAGVLPLYNAIGIILGANLGTTMTGWIVTSIGFKLSLSQLALPAMAAGALLQLLPMRAEKLRSLGLAVFGLGLILLGLDIMKDAVATLPEKFDADVLQGHGTLVYFAAGTLIAAVLQSSSATMMLTLAALNGGLIGLSAAAALVIGADLGTTSTTALGSLTGHPIKRQLALGHVLFNIAVDLAALFILLPALPTLLALTGLSDPLYSLVAFHSLFNLLGLAVFLPVLKPYTRWLGQRFSPPGEETRLNAQSLEVPDAALAASARQLDAMRIEAGVLTLHLFHLRPEQLGLTGAIAQALDEHYNQRISVPDRYSMLKSAESQLLAFAMALQKGALNREQAQTLHQQIREARALVYSSKTQMDIRENIASLRHAQSDPLSRTYQTHRKFTSKVYRHYLELACSGRDDAITREEINKLLAENDRLYEQHNERIHAMTAAPVSSDPSLPSVLNVNRDMHHSIKDLLSGWQGD